MSRASVTGYLVNMQGIGYQYKQRAKVSTYNLYRTDDIEPKAKVQVSVYDGWRAFHRFQSIIDKMHWACNTHYTLIDDSR